MSEPLRRVKKWSEVDKWTRDEITAANAWCRRHEGRHMTSDEIRDTNLAFALLEAVADQAAHLLNTPSPYAFRQLRRALRATGSFR